MSNTNAVPNAVEQVPPVEAEHDRDRCARMFARRRAGGQEREPIPPPTGALDYGSLRRANS